MDEEEENVESEIDLVAQATEADDVEELLKDLAKTQEQAVSPTESIATPVLTR